MPSAARPSWGPVTGSTPRFLMVTMIKWREANNACSRSREDLADEVGVTPDTVGVTAAKLEQWEMIRQHDTPRSAYGNFGGKRYDLRVDRAEVRELIAYYDPPERGVMAGTSNPTDTPPEIFEEETKTPDGKSLSPIEIILELCQQIQCGAYKDSRAQAGASKRIIYHSLPDDHGIDDEELIERLKQALAVCGEGTVGVPTYRLVESLAHHIPRALEEGYDFKRDIIACIRFYTRNARKESLNRFDVTFRDDLPKWRLERLRRDALKEQRAIETFAPQPSGERFKTPKGTKKSLAPQPVNDEAKRRQRIEGVIGLIAAIDSGNRSDWILDNKDDKRLWGEKREEAFSRQRSRFIAELRGFGVVGAYDTRSATADPAEPPHAHEDGVASIGASYGDDEDVG